MAEKIPERLKWAVESLGLSGDEAILEIGCGRGVAVSLACPKLHDGKITAIDRSATAINAARERNAAALAAGRRSSGKRRSRNSRDRPARSTRSSRSM